MKSVLSLILFTVLAQPVLANQPEIMVKCKGRGIESGFKITVENSRGVIARVTLDGEEHVSALGISLLSGQQLQFVSNYVIEPRGPALLVNIDTENSYGSYFTYYREIEDDFRTVYLDCKKL